MTKTVIFMPSRTAGLNKAPCMRPRRHDHETTDAGCLPGRLSIGHYKQIRACDKEPLQASLVTCGMLRDPGELESRFPIPVCKSYSSEKIAMIPRRRSPLATSYYLWDSEPAVSSATEGGRIDVSDGGHESYELQAARPLVAAQRLVLDRQYHRLVGRTVCQIAVET